MGSSEEAPLLLLETVEDITEDWVVRLLNNREDHSEPRPLIRLRRWSRGECPSKDSLAGFSSSRATIKVEYEVERDAQETSTKEETFVIKVIPTHGLMAELLTADGMHEIEVGQYGRFLRTLYNWERDRRGGSGGIMSELVPSHALAVSTHSHFTIVLPDLRYYGYEPMDVKTGLNERQLVTVAAKLGSFHGTVVAFKTITGTDLQDAFPKCFNVAESTSQAFEKFGKPCFELVRKTWSGDPEKAEVLKALGPYEEQIIPFVVSSLMPKEPFATAIHGDLQASNTFFKETPNGELTLKLIDWATSRYTQGPIDLVYLLNISVEPEVRRRATPKATEVYFEAFNTALTELGADLSYPRSTFDAELKLGYQLLVVWSVMISNLFMTCPQLQERLFAILSDILTDPNIEPPKGLLPSNRHPNNFKPSN